MKIGIISDTHLQKVTEDFVSIFQKHLSDADMILHAGDWVSSDLVRFFNKKPFHGVYGNMDPHDVRELLPEKKTLDLGKHRLGLIHGWGPANDLEDRIRPVFPDVDIIVYGHSHSAANHLKNNVLFFNPGTATGYSSSNTHSIGILEIGETIKGRIIPI